MGKGSRNINWGLLVLRVGVGLLLMVHGFPKLVAGPERWATLGGAMATVGITFAPAFWGLMATATEFFGGLLLVAGLFTRPVAALACFTMIIATLFVGGNLMDAGEGGPSLLDLAAAVSHPLTFAIACLSLALMGAGSFSLTARIAKLNNRWYG